MMPKSIFDLEVRLDFDKEYDRIIETIESDIFKIPNYSNITFEQLANSVFKFWPYRHTARTVLEYFELLNVNFASFAISKADKLYNIQFILDFLIWIADYHPHISKGYDRKEVESILSNIRLYNNKTFVMLIQNIEIIIESLNMKIETINDHITFIKRDSDIDSVLSQLEDQPDIRLLLLSYNDFRVENNLEDKQHILKKLADWLEPQREKYKSINNSLTSDVFSAINNGSIRHNNHQQWFFETKEEQIKMYDKIFKLILHLIREEDVKMIREYIKSLS